MNGDKVSLSELENGDATALPAGTNLYTRKGYKPEYSLLAPFRGGELLSVYVALPNSRLETNADVLDFAGKVERIEIFAWSNAPRSDESRVTQISEPEEVRRALEELLQARLLWWKSEFEEGERYAVFVLVDGTRVAQPAILGLPKGYWEVFNP